MDHNYSALKGVPFCISSRCQPPPVTVITAPPQIPNTCRFVSFDLRYERDLLQALDETKQEQARLMKRLEEYHEQRHTTPKKSDSNLSFSYLMNGLPAPPSQPPPPAPPVQYDDPFDMVEMETTNDMELLGQILEDMALSTTTTSPSSAASDSTSNANTPTLPSPPFYALPAALDNSSGPSLPTLLKYATVGFPLLSNPVPRTVVTNLPTSHSQWSKPHQQPVVETQTRAQPPETLYLEANAGAVRQKQVGLQEAICKDAVKEERRVAELRLTHRNSLGKVQTTAEPPPNHLAGNPQYQRLTAMGFPRDLVELAIGSCKEDDSKMVEFIINVGVLVDEGAQTVVAGDALSLMGNEMERARTYIHFHQQLVELGFRHDRIKEAILLFPGQLAQAADYLMQQDTSLP